MKPPPRPENPVYDMRQMLSVKIDVRGLGGGINHEMKIIADAFRAAGYDVEIDNNGADWPVSAAPGWHEAMSQKVKDSPGQYLIKLKANHEPWGG